MAVAFDNHIQILVTPALSVELDNESYRKVNDDFSFGR